MAKGKKKTVYTLFDGFVDKISNGESLFSDKKVFTKDSIVQLKVRIIDNAIGNPKDDINAKKVLEELNKKTSKNEESLSFDDKINYQLQIRDFDNKDKSNDKELIIELFANLLWLRNLPIFKTGMTKDFKNKELGKYLKNKENEIKVRTAYEGISGYGMLALQKYDDISALIYLFMGLFDADTKIEDIEKKTILSKIEDLIKNPIKVKGDKISKVAESFYKRPIVNILLNLCDYKNYEPIAGYNDKNLIVKSFESLILGFAEDDMLKMPLVDQKIKGIKKKLVLALGFDNEDFSFYLKDIKPYWNFKGIESNHGFSELDALKIKKQIVFFGPPGTSKTYSAKELAKIMTRQAFIEYHSSNIGEVFKVNYDEENDKRIINLQLHPNYSYEDFIVGMKIVNNSTEWEKGFLLKLINSIQEDNDKYKGKDKEKYKNIPYFLILDEINRVDLSRLFGELFSAIENRKDAITLSAVDKDKDKDNEFCNLKIPENLYFIGTMNQIDFSLERIDFALRRRFVWYFYGYDESRLKSIIEAKQSDLPINQDHIDEFITRASKLNSEIAKDDEFGKEWQIGHTFFAEIVDIALNFEGKKSIALYVKRKTDGKFTTAKDPVIILWNISIKPMLEAYCGNLDKVSKDVKMKVFEEIFIGKK